MTLEKPKFKRTHVTLTDPETRKSRCLTLYGLNFNEMYEKLQSDASIDEADDNKPNPPRRGRRFPATPMANKAA